jgi:hypothetical protein
MRRRGRYMRAAEARGDRIRNSLGSAVTRQPLLPNKRRTINRGGAPFPFPFSLPQPRRRQSTGCVQYLLATTYDYDSLRGTTPIHLSLHMLAAISPPAHDLSQSMPYSHTRTTSRSALPDLNPPAETKTCPGCQQTVMDENGGVVIAFG